MPYKDPEKAAENNRRQNDKRRQARRAEKKGIPAMLKVVSQDRNERQLEGNAK